MIDRHIAGHLERIKLHRASLAQLGKLVLNDTERSRTRLQNDIDQLEAVNAYLANFR